MSPRGGVPEFDLKRGRRRTIALHLDRLGRLEVRAPYWVSRKAIVEFVIERAAWIETQRARLSQQPVFEEPQFCEGGWVRLFGERRLLQLGVHSLSPLVQQQVEATLDIPQSGPALGLCLPVAANATADTIEAAYRKLLRAALLDYLNGRIAWWLQHDAFHDLPPLELRIRLMKRRWGSCRRDGRLTFSESLAKYPPECIDAVIVHELCHFRHFNHGRGFYALLSSVLPEWRSADLLLESEARRY